MPLETYQYLLELVKSRRTVRRFRPDPVPDGTVEKILDVARWAPSGFHTQPWEYVVVQKPETRQAIIEVLDRDAPPITRPDDTTAGKRASFRDAPVFIILLADWRAKAGLPGHPTEIDERVKSIFCSSLASTFLYMHLAAASLGLASQWYSSAARPKAEEAIRRILGIPAPLTIYDMMVLGYPAVTPGPKEVRNLVETVHYDDCGPDDFRTDAQVLADAAKTWNWCMSEH